MLMRRTLAFLLCLGLLTGCAIILLLARGPRTAPSLKVTLLSCTNRSASVLTFPTSSTSQPAQPSMIILTNEAEVEVFNRGSQIARISGVSINFRPITDGLTYEGISRQRILRGKLGALEPGVTRKFLVQFNQDMLVSPLEGRTTRGVVGDVFSQVQLIHPDDKGQICASCEAKVGGPGQTVSDWVRRQPWGKYLPQVLLRQQIRAYTFSGAWTEQ